MSNNEFLGIPVYSEKEQKRIDESAAKKEEQYANDIESIGQFISDVLKKDVKYVETYKLNDRNEIDRDTVIKVGGGRTILEMSHVTDISVEGLGNLAGDIVKKYKNIRLSAKVEDSILTLTFESQLAVGALVNWVSRGRYSVA